MRGHAVVAFDFEGAARAGTDLQTRNPVEAHCHKSQRTPRESGRFVFRDCFDECRQWIIRTRAREPDEPGGKASLESSSEELKRGQYGNAVALG